MADPILVAARLVQYAAAAILFGLPAFRLYGLSTATRAAERGLLAGAATALPLGALLALSRQAAGMTGDPAAATDPSAWWDVATATQVGHALGFRVAAGLACLAILLWAGRSGAVWRSVAVVAGAAMASFAWSGHGAAGEGPVGAVQLVADVVHLLAAGLWLGALAGLSLAAASAEFRTAPGRAALTAALEGFSGIGSALVAALLATGLVNGWILVTPAKLPNLLQTAYGALLAAKLGLFAVMLACAALNRFRLTAALRATAGDSGPALAPLRANLFVETVCGAGVLALVALFGLLAPGM